MGLGNFFKLFKHFLRLTLIAGEVQLVLFIKMKKTDRQLVSMCTIYKFKIYAGYERFTVSKFKHEYNRFVLFLHLNASWREISVNFWQVGLCVLSYSCQKAFCCVFVIL